MVNLIKKNFKGHKEMEWFKKFRFAKQVTTKKSYVWKDFKTWKRDQGSYKK